MNAKNHPPDQPRGVRDPLLCKVQSGGRLVWIQDGQPMFWSDRPMKFPSHIRLMLTKRGGTTISDIKWRKLAGKAWWRLPDWPDGTAIEMPQEDPVSERTLSQPAHDQRMKRARHKRY